MTSEYVGVNQNFTITTQTSKKSNGIFMQAWNRHVTCCLIFIATSTAQWELINNGISKPVSPPSLPHSIRGIVAHRHCSTLTNHVEKLIKVSFSVVLCFSPPFPMFSHRNFSIKFQFCCWCRRPSLGPQGDISPLPSSPVHKCHREAGNSEFPHFQYFLT